MKDFIFYGEEIFINFREGTIVYPQLKQILFQNSTSHKTSSLVVFKHSQKERDVSSTKARKTKRSVQVVVPCWFSLDGSHSFYLAVVPVTQADRNGSGRENTG